MDDEAGNSCVVSLHGQGAMSLQELPGWQAGLTGCTQAQEANTHGLSRILVPVVRLKYLDY